MEVKLVYIKILLVNISLYISPITFHHDVSNHITQLYQGRTQRCQKLTLEEHIFGQFALAHLTFGSCTSPTYTFPFTYLSFKGTGMWTVDNFQHLIFGNSQSPNQFTGNPKIVIHLTSVQDSPKHKSRFTFTLSTIYEVNGTARCLPRQIKRPSGKIIPVATTPLSPSLPNPYFYKYIQGFWPTHLYRATLTHTVYVCVCMCVCVFFSFWSPVIITYPKYEAVGFQPQAVNIPDLCSVHPPSAFSKLPMLKIYASNEIKLTKNRQWENLLATSVGSGAAPIT